MRVIQKSILVILIVSGNLSSNRVIYPGLEEKEISNKYTLNSQPKYTIVSEEKEKPNQIIYLDRVSFYQAKVSQTNSDPSTSACGKTKKPWKQIAVSRDLFNKLGCGKEVILHLPDKKIKAVIWDTMNKRYINSADVLVGHDEPAFKYGITKGILEIP